MRRLSSSSLLAARSPHSSCTRPLVSDMSLPHPTSSTHWISQPTKPKDGWVPTYIFLFGTLLDRDILESVLELPSSPNLHNASVTGYKTKLWSRHSVLVEGDDTIDGKAYRCESKQHFERLTRYVTNKSCNRDCSIYFTDTGEIKEGILFMWAGDQNSPQLRDGVFNLEVFQREYKPFMGLSDRKSRKEKMVWEPSFLFFYGALQDADLLKHILGLPTKPKLYRSTITGFLYKMWGRYPTLIPAVHCEDEISGWTYYCETDENFQKLSRYETGYYRSIPCKIFLQKDADGDEEGRQEDVKGRVFVWNGDPAGRELEDGTFDIEHWRKYFLSGVLKRTEEDGFWSGARGGS